MPRFAFEKFPAADPLTTQMKSVGEVMAIGRTFPESLQKALRGLEPAAAVKCDATTQPDDDQSSCSATPAPSASGTSADAFRASADDRRGLRAAKIDPWFLAQIRRSSSSRATVRQRDQALGA